jgi:AraC-like DNA-binding protein
MRYLVGKNAKPLVYVSSGKSLENRHFILEKRCLDTCVVVICIQGEVHIMQDGRRYTLTKNKYLILFEGHVHQGFKKSVDKTSFYWCHFKAGKEAHIVDQAKLSSLFVPSSKASKKAAPYPEMYILPEYGEITANGRAVLIFRQLLDLARGKSYSAHLPNFSLSLLVMEISQEFIEEYQKKAAAPELKPRIEQVAEWVRINYTRNLKLTQIAKILQYNPDYLSTAFRKYKKMPLMKYITRMRISRAKELLLNSNLTIKEIAAQVGYSDEQSFMKRFRLIEDISPTKFRNAFSRIKLVK